MAKVIIALGSNLNDPHKQLLEAGVFLNSISDKPLQSSWIYKSEPIGTSENDFLNAVACIETDLTAEEIFVLIKEQEKKQGRPSRYPKWSARTIDLDIIAYDDLVVHTDNLIIPHSEYAQRLFVLKPLKDIFPNWIDPGTAQHIDQLIDKAPKLRILKTELNW